MKYNFLHYLFIVILLFTGCEDDKKGPTPVPPIIDIPVVDTTDAFDTIPAIDTIIVPPVEPPVITPKDTIAKVFNIELSEDPNEDQTISLQKQIDAVPDGSPDAWNVIQLPEGRFWTEGDKVYRHLQDDGIITVWNRNYIFIRGPSAENKTVFYTKAPAVPYGGNVGANQYSYRRHLWIRFSSNIVVENIKIEGSNNIDGRKIGTTPELTPDFWYYKYDTIKKSTDVAGWWIDQNEKRLIGGREIPDFSNTEIVLEDGKVQIVEVGPEVQKKKYLSFLREGIKHNELVPGGKDDGSVGGSPAYKSYWEQEHAIDARASTNTILRNIDVDGVWGDGIYVGGDQRYDPTLKKNVWVPAINTVISNSHLRFTGRQGIAVGNNVEGVLIEYVWGELGRRAFIDLEPDLTANYIDGVVIRYNKTNTAQTVIAAVGNGRVDNVYVHDNVFSGGGHFIICYDSLLKTKRKNWRVENNTRTGGFGSPIADIRFALTDSIIIKNNVTRIGATQSLKSAEFTNCNAVYIIGNDFGAGQFIDNRNSEIILEDNIPEQTFS